MEKLKPEGTATLAQKKKLEPQLIHKQQNDTMRKILYLRTPNIHFVCKKEM